MSMFKISKKLILNIIVSVTTIFIVFICLEIGLRWKLQIFPFRYECKQNRGFVLDAQLGYRVKNVKGYNSLGLKNPEISQKTNQFRILLLGDSVLNGFETDLLKKRLKEYCPYLKIEVINAGVPGYTTKQELDFLKIYGLDLKPDLLILGFVLNDLFIYLQRPDSKGGLGGIHPYAERTWFGENCFFGRIFYHSYFAHYIVKKINLARLELKRRSGIPTYEFEINYHFHNAWKEFAWPEEERLLAEMKASLELNNIPMVIVCFPVKEQVEERNIKKDKSFMLKPQHKLLDICHRLKIPLLDLWGDFYERRDGSNFNGYIHFTHEGNVIIADKLAEFINLGGFIKKVDCDN
jgi:hypothetical protein